MMRANNVQFLGNLVAEPKTITGKNGDFSVIRMATNTRRGDNERTMYIDVKCFSRAHADVEYHQLDKGDRVLVEGELVQEEYDDSAGVKRRSYAVYANSVMKINRRAKEEETDF